MGSVLSIMWKRKKKEKGKIDVKDGFKLLQLVVSFVCKVYLQSLLTMWSVKK